MAGEALKKLCNIAICAINVVFCRIWKLHYGIIAQNCLSVHSVRSACIKTKAPHHMAGWSDWAAPRSVRWTVQGVSAAREWTIVNIELPYADALRCFNIRAPHRMARSSCIIVLLGLNPKCCDGRECGPLCWMRRGLPKHYLWQWCHCCSNEQSAILLYCMSS